MADVRINDYSLMRARNGRMCAGVAAGLAKASGMDVTLVRLCIGAMVLSGFGVPAYILMWIILPEESRSRGRELERAPEHTARIIRITLIALGVLSAFNKVGGFLSFTSPHNRGVGFDGAIGLILLGIGIAVLFSRHRPDQSLWKPVAEERATRTPFDGDDDDPPKFAGPLADVMGTVHGAVSDAFSEVRTTFSESRPRRGTAATYDEDDDFDTYVDGDPESEPRATRIATATVDGDVRHSGGAALAWARIVGWLLLIWWSLSALGLAGLWAIGAVSVRSPIVLSVAGWLVFIAVLNTLLHAKFARAIIPSLALLLVPMGLAAATVRVNGDIGDFVHTPATANGTLSYNLAVGRMQIDLAGTDFKKPTTIDGRVNVGQLDVTVPNNATVKVNTRTNSAGAYEIFGRTSNGFSPDDSTSYEGCKNGPKLTLNLRTGVGQIVVHRANGSNVRTCEDTAA